MSSRNCQPRQAVGLAIYFFLAFWVLGHWPIAHIPTGKHFLRRNACGNDGQSLKWWKSLWRKSSKPHKTLPHYNNDWNCGQHKSRKQVQFAHNTTLTIITITPKRKLVRLRISQKQMFSFKIQITKIVFTFLKKS